jgi:O-antigen ligase
LSFIGSNQDIGTLTGRLPLWENLWEAVISRPLIGFGFGAYRAQSPELGVYLSPEQLRLSVAHNALIEAVVASGLVGGLLRLALIGMVILTTWRARGSWSPAARALLMLLLVSSLTGSHTAGIGIGWYALLAVAFLVSHQPTPTDHKDMAESTRERYIRSSASRWNF